MTQPQNPQDPFASSTRRFDPDQPTSAYPSEPYPDAGQQYGTAQYGAEQYGQDYNGGGGSRRTKVLIGSIVAALLAILLVAFLISVTGGKGSDEPVPVTSETTSSTTTEETTTSETTTSEETSTETSPPAPAGQVVYRLVGDGDLIVVRYNQGAGQQTLATVRSPWSVTANVPDGAASFDAIVVRGSVTCQILVGGAVVTEGTSSGGPLNCSATVE
ncbi:hypothetical protein GOARA_068_00740 [Gordonia araii NBRC 100433]|uniref:MmpS family membrane protein n=1 Tax=Gordonia araii NBRC 100433 TaxID=1073574 RepID=G7H6E0_9ACTN|nr:MmpS family transport accessory protein [Gordonia araii]NNG96095.1 hypothetical protein [Gordonia araii NBRC 100433]GAB11415.1 hypothetical protein GOARA_068_00740 [Gordonia araii NBRC 100433]